MTEGDARADSDPELVLRIVPSQGAPYDHVVREHSLVVGRSSTTDLVLADRFLSRRHTRIFRSDEPSPKWLVEDLGSHNGTILNGQKLDRPAALSPGDVLVLSSTTVRVRSMDGAAGGVAPTGPASDSSVRRVLRDATIMLSRDPLSDPTRSRDEKAVRKYTDRLRLLNEIHGALGRSVSLEELFGLILDRVFDALKPEQGWILVKDRGLAAAAGAGAFSDADAPQISFAESVSPLRAVAARSVDGGQPAPPESKNLDEEVMGKRMAALVVDAETDERFAAAQSLLVSGIKSLLAAPLLAGDSDDEDGVLGMLLLSSRAHVKLFDEDDLELLVSLASVAALRIRNVALAEEAAERRRLEKELALARRIQERLLPDALPEVEGWQLFAQNLPSRGVSGDYYTLVQHEHEGSAKLSVIIADVSGKGMAASLLTASLEALCAGPIEQGEAPKELCEQVSRRLFVRTPPEKYATALVLDVDTATGKVRYCNAGHNPGLLVRADGEIERLDSSGPPIGMLPNIPFRGGEVEVGKGDLVVLYTDGITEAANPDDEEFGVERLEQVCREVRFNGPNPLGEAIGRRLDQFAQGVPYADDRTLVILQRNG